MRRETHKLTAVGIKALTKPGRYGDGDGLYLRVAPGGSRQWVLRVVHAGQRRDIGLGGYPRVPLAAARKRAAEFRLTIWDGGDPVVERQRRTGKTFRAVAVKYFKDYASSWRSDKTRAIWTQQMERHAYPKVGGRQIASMGREDVLNVIMPLVKAGKANTAKKMKTRLRAVFSFAVAHDLCQSNPAEEIDGALPTVAAAVEHHHAIPYSDVPAALDAIREANSSPAVKLAIELLILTACRSGEVRGATWSEVDLEAATWTIPPSRMKANREHVVPLAPAAVKVLEAAREHSRGDLVFPGRAGGQLSTNTMVKALRAAGLSTTAHGFRSCFRDWASERTDADHAIMERCLAHEVGSAVERAYARSDFRAKRRGLMERWAAFCTAEQAKVVTLARTA